MMEITKKDIYITLDLTLYYHIPRIITSMLYYWLNIFCVKLKDVIIGALWLHDWIVSYVGDVVSSFFVNFLGKLSAWSL